MRRTWTRGCVLVFIICFSTSSLAIAGDTTRPGRGLGSGATGIDYFAQERQRLLRAADGRQPRLNSERFPESANPWDSLAEAYVASGERELAIESCRKALAIAPTWWNSLRMLRDLEGS